MKKILYLGSFFALLLVTVLFAASGTPSTLRVNTDSSGNLLVASATLTGSTTSSVFSNTRLNTDANGNLLVVLSGGVTPTFPILAPTSTDCTAPPYSFTGRTTTGLNSQAANTWNLCAGGTLGLSGNTTNLLASLSIQLVGTTSSFPMLKRNATAINFRLADDSADAPITASTVRGSGETSGSDLRADPGGAIYWNTRALLISSGAGFLNIRNSTAQTAGVNIDIGTADGTVAFLSRGGADTAIVKSSIINASSQYQYNGNAFATTTVGPSAPTGTTSTTLVMAGLAGSFTTRTGRAMICMSGVLQDSGANDGSKAQISYGTGTAPVNGAALTGTQVGPIQQYNASTLAAAASAPYGACWVVTTLTPNTVYWLDTAFAAITAGTATITQATMVANDIP